MRMLGIGEVLWDISSKGESLGGAPLNFLAHLVRLGNTASLISAVGDDALGRKATDEIANLGVSTDFLVISHLYKTGVARVSTDNAGNPSFAIQRPAAFDDLNGASTLIECAVQYSPDWIYIGTLFQSKAGAQELTSEFIRALPESRVFYDVNLRPGNWNAALIGRLSSSADIVKMSDQEARVLAETEGLHTDAFALKEFCKKWVKKYQLKLLCVTCGKNGCFIYQSGGTTVHSPAYPTAVRDPVGAGDAFAAAFLHAFHKGWSMKKSARFANALGSIVASRYGAIPDWNIRECLELASLTRE